jgi:hypothetical protein
VWDLAVSGLGVRVNANGRKVFILSARYPGHSNTQRRRLGDCPTMTLAEARAEAERWKRLVAQGIDPQHQRANTFAAVAEDFFAHIKRQGQQRALDVERAVRRVFVAQWR